MTDLEIDRSDTSRWSYHVDGNFYDRLKRYVGEFASDWPAQDAAAATEAQAFLVAEARLVDEGRFNDWIEMFTPDCLYWVPIAPGAGDPCVEVSHAFDDMRRLQDRVYWLRTGLAFSQIPQSRTRRLVSNVETVDVEEVPHGRLVRLVRSNFFITEFRAGVTKLHAGWYGHVLVLTDLGWRIRLKQVNLIDSEQVHENLTLVF